MRETLGNLKMRSQEAVHRWEERSKELVKGFLRMFGVDGRIVSFTTPFLPFLSGPGEWECVLNAEEF